MKQKVKCDYCKEERDIIRKKRTSNEYSFWCVNCRKEVPQDLFYRKKQDNNLLKVNN